MSLLPELLLTVLFGTQASFTHPGVILPQKETLGDNELKGIVKRTQRSREARETLGFSPRVWKALMETLRSGNDQLVANQHHLIHKVWDLTVLGRNLLAAKEKAQNLAAEEGFEAEIRRLLDICIDKASKPITPNPDKAAHENQMQLKNSYKKVLITSLQFLNNLISCNETRKLHLWLHLFGTPSSVAAAATSTGTPLGNTPKNSPKPKSKSSPKPQSASGSGVGVIGNITGTSTAGLSSSSHTETVAKCNSLSAGFNARYYKPGFLTEVPRILVPDEIEALPMILHSGVVAFEGADQAMQSVRCKLMLAQGYGRNLLREILVFLGAWEVDEDDFCYRMMIQVIDAILINGLIPYAYECFRYEKDIVSPAQAVLLKLLVSVYRPSMSSNSGQGFTEPSSSAIPFRSPTFIASPLAPDGPSDHPHAIETSIPTFFLTVFRKHVLPSIVKIVKMQGAVHKGTMKKEKFEFSLWDLDRIYEGLYQFFDLLVLFSEDEEARKIMVAGDKGLISELTDLLSELVAAIPRYVASKSVPPPPLAAPEGAGVKGVKVEEAFKVERPFDVCEDENGDEGEYEDEEDVDEDDRSLSEPEDFSWPHVKRFIVLLISNCAWKNKEVQDLVREKKGLGLVLGLCMIDDDNPFIREHAILCIRNLLEGNRENQTIVRELDAVQAVPSEVLDKQGYEHFIDDNGKVQLRKKPVAKNVRANAPNT
ncbi:hypothetical protein RUND412_001743 [Rhizina undulata]